MINIKEIVTLTKSIPCGIVVNAQDYVSENFRWIELADRSTMTLKFSPDLLRLVQYVRTEQNWVIDTTQGLSWYRTAEFNKQIGGVPTSRHIKGLATDLKCWIDRVGGRQVHPIHVAYAFQEAFKKLNYRGCIGTYLPLYDNESGGYNHIDLRETDVLYACYEKGILENINSLADIRV